MRTPQDVFNQPQRLTVPLFQRPYVWNENNQWDPLWSDLLRVTERYLEDPRRPHHPHFLGAVVIQQVQNPVGSMQERTIIDGQQRLTTLQLLLDALHIELDAVGATQPAMRVDALVTNAAAFCDAPEDRFKVWPTNRDRPAFNSVMAAEPPLNYEVLEERSSRLVQAHRFFATRAREWLHQGKADAVVERAAALERSVRELLQLVVIDLTADENAQEIFETLNARGAQLTAADLIKNFIFQRLMESGVDVEPAYEQYWKDFETGFWETEINLGRVRYPRSAVFLNHWLIDQTGEEIVAREVFYRFKRYADFDAGTKMVDLLEQIDRAAAVYRDFVEASAAFTGPIDRVGLFAYRTSVLESEVVKPLLLYLLDPEEVPIPRTQLHKALDVVESWMVRRMLVRVTTKSYTQVVAELISHLRDGDRAEAGDRLEEYLATRTGANWYWPDDDEVRGELRNLQVYRRLRRGRLRMVLEAVEDYLRGWGTDQIGLGGERVARGQYAIEHVMPRKWQTHWPMTADAHTEYERDQVIHTLGNLTLLTGRLNTKVSNGPWMGDGGKYQALHGHDVLMLNRDLLAASAGGWSDAAIRDRTDQLIEAILQIWRVPEGHKSGFAEKRPTATHRVELADLINAGLVEPGATLYPRRKSDTGRTATVLPDGALDVEGKRFSTPSGAARHMTGKSANGWWYFLVDPASRRSLRDIWRDYVDQLSVDVEDDEAIDEDDAG